MRTLIPFFLLSAALIVWFCVLPKTERRRLFSRKYLSITALVLVSWALLLVVAVLQSQSTIPLF